MNDMSNPAPLLARLGIAAVNPGACLGPDRWRGGGAEIASDNPATGRAIARVRLADASDVDAVLAAAVAAARQWREVPAPKRGEAVRRFGLLLREHKDALGTLVALENGKIKAEGDGEVQEMIDIADFAVGQSRMLYGRTIASERPQHRMMEQWHPLGVVAVITAFNFPVAVWAWNAMLAAVCGDATVWKPSPKTPLTAHRRAASRESRHDGISRCRRSSRSRFAATPKRSALVADSRVALVSFTGSSRGGTRDREHGRRALRQDACSSARATTPSSSRTTPTSILSCRAVLFGAVGTAGQRCTIDAAAHRASRSRRRVVGALATAPTRR